MCDPVDANENICLKSNQSNKNVHRNVDKRLSKYVDKGIGEIICGKEIIKTLTSIL